MDKEDDKQESHKEEFFPTASLADSSAVIGEQIGPYKLLSVLGEGGFGMVYLAEQKHPIKRQVALKVIKPGMDSKRIVARFEAERQALALLDHPGIAHIFEAGSTESGRPYFVMEYINGMPITDYCDYHKLSIEDRLTLFIQVCQAVQHAHQKGIIHRDIKPSNIVVSLQDGKAVPKVIDFGVAKALGMPLTDKTIFTQQGQLVGTPEYMSPEQADQREKDIDTRTDIYSLGIVLYELLAGTLPFESKTLREAGYAAIGRIIKEQEPPRPSTKLSSLGADAAKVAQNRHTEVSTLVSSLHRELEWIPLMAIRKERELRYQTASGLAEDIQNYVDGHPLKAGPESALYRFKKILKKYRAIAAAVASVAAILVISLVVITHLYFQSDKLRIAAIESGKVAVAEKNHADILRIKAEGAVEEKRKQAYFDTVKKIYSDMKNTGSTEVPKMLKECPEDLRNWEYDYLQNMYEQSSMTIPAYEMKWIRGISFTSDGSEIISAGLDGTVRSWDSMTGNELQRLQMDPNISYMDFSPDGRYGLTAAKNVLNLWDLQKKTAKKIVVEQNQAVSSVIFSKDSKRFAAAFGTAESMVRIWDIPTGQEIQHIFCGAEVRVVGMDFSPDGTQLALIILSARTGLQLRDIASGRLLREAFEYDFSKKEPGLIFSDVEFDVTGDYILTAHWDQTRVWYAETLQIKTTVPSVVQEGSSRAIFSPDGSAFVTGGGSNLLKIWDFKTGRCLRTLQIPSGSITCFAYNPDGTRLAAGDNSGMIKLWDIAVQQDLIEIGLPDSGEISRIPILNPDGTLLALQGTHRTIRIWDTAALKEVGHPLEGHTAYIVSTAFSPDGKKLASCSLDKTIRIWDVTESKEICPPIMPESPEEQSGVYSVIYSPDGNSIVSGGGDGIIRIWNPQTRHIIRTLEGHKKPAKGEVCPIWILRFTPDGKQLLSGGEDTTVRIWDFDTGKCLDIFSGHTVGGIGAFEIGPDGSTIASIAFPAKGMPETIIWNKVTKEPLCSLKGAVFRFSDLQFSKDGKRLFCMSSNGYIEVWDTQTWQCVLTIGEGQETGRIYDCELSPDGKTIYATLLSKAGLLVCSTKSIGKDTGKRTSEIAFNTYLKKGSAYYDNGRLEEAVELLKKAIGLNPDNRAAHYNLLKVYHELAYSESRSLENIVGMCEKTKWKDWFCLGVLASKYSRFGDFVQAVKWQKDAIDCLPHDISSIWTQTYNTNLHSFQKNEPSVVINVWSFSEGNQIAHWTFDECVGNTVKDSSGNGLDGQLVGNAKIITDPERGRVLSLDGKGSYVDCGQDWEFDISGAITVSAWIKVNKFEASWHAIITKGDTSWRLQQFIDNESIEFACTGISNQPWGHIGGAVDVNDGQWHHIAGVYNGQEISLFVDGQLDVSEKATGNIVINQSPVFIGSNAAYNRPNPYGRDWIGLLDDVRVYSYALSADEIEKLHRDSLINNRK